jgi:hypothetical protein
MGAFRPLSILVAVALAFSGCAGGSAESSESTPAPASVIVGDTAAGGRIVGTVVSDELAPVQGATAGLKGIEITAVSDKEGRFEFQNVPAGQHTLFVARLGYESVPKQVTVNDGETTEVTVSLNPIAVEEDFVESLEFKLYMACGGGLVGVTFTGGCPAQLGNHKVAVDHNVTNKVLSALSELVWIQNSAASSKELRLDMGKDESGGTLPAFKYKYGSATGKSPVAVRADAEFDGLSDEADDGDYKIRHRVWVPFRSADPPVVIIVLQQPMTLWSSMAYGSPLPEVYSALPDA